MLMLVRRSCVPVLASSRARPLPIMSRGIAGRQLRRVRWCLRILLQALNRVNKWITTGFDASSWLPALRSSDPAGTPMLTVNPLLYERPVATQWISTRAGHDAYFVRQFAVPFLYSNAWLRLAVTGTASVCINGHLLITWNG